MPNALHSARLSVCRVVLHLYPNFVYSSNPAFISQLQALCPLDQNRGGEWTFRSASEPGPGPESVRTRDLLCVCVCVKGAASVRRACGQTSALLNPRTLDCQLEIYFCKALRHSHHRRTPLTMMSAPVFFTIVSRNICPCAVSRWSEDFLC
jgi:hypothetical protein